MVINQNEAVKFKHKQKLQILSTDWHSAHWIPSFWHEAVRAALPLETEEEEHVALTRVWACQSTLTAAFGISLRYKTSVFNAKVPHVKQEFRQCAWITIIHQSKMGITGKRRTGGKHSPGWSYSHVDLTWNRKATYLCLQGSPPPSVLRLQ